MKNLMKNLMIGLLLILLYTSCGGGHPPGYAPEYMLGSEVCLVLGLDHAIIMDMKETVPELYLLKFGSVGSWWEEWYFSYEMMTLQECWLLEASR